MLVPAYNERLSTLPLIARRAKQTAMGPKVTSWLISKNRFSLVSCLSGKNSVSPVTERDRSLPKRLTSSSGRPLSVPQKFNPQPTVFILKPGILMGGGF